MSDAPEHTALGRILSTVSTGKFHRLTASVDGFLAIYRSNTSFVNYVNQKSNKKIKVII